mmetsp:Transcript_38339/g.93938  ORF Transcript_38339/g.93938 Transcript_38339/m.93938 type:complete len:121 (-) Transcript_38339:144-506(-)
MAICRAAHRGILSSSALTRALLKQASGFLKMFDAAVSITVASALRTARRVLLLQSSLAPLVVNVIVLADPCCGAHLVEAATAEAAAQAAGGRRRRRCQGGGRVGARAAVRGGRQRRRRRR